MAGRERPLSYTLEFVRVRVRLLWPEESARSVTLNATTAAAKARLWPEESARSVTLAQLRIPQPPALWPEESARSVTLISAIGAFELLLWPEESARSVTLSLPQPADRTRVVALFGLEKHELHWWFFGWFNGFSYEDRHLSKLAIGD